MSRRGGSRHAIAGATVVVLVAVLLALAGLILHARTGSRTARDSGAETATGAAATASGDDAVGGLVLSGADLTAAGTELSLSLRVHNADDEPVVVTAVATPATATATLRSALPRGGVRLAAHAQGVLLLVWSGPDCAVAPPDRVIGDLTYTLTDERGATATGLLLTGAADDLLRKTWRDTCEGEGSAPPAPDGS